MVIHPKTIVDRAILLKLIHRYLNGLLDPSISPLELQSLMYFMQELGEPLNLKFTKAIYGPYAENLRDALNEIEGHYISGYSNCSDAPDKELTLIPGAVEEANQFLESHPETRKRFDQVSQLIEGFESPFGLELLATTHWVIKYDGSKTQPEVEEQIYSWNDRKRQFTPRQITLAANVVRSI